MDVTVNAPELKKALRIPKAAAVKASGLPTLRGLRLTASEGDLAVAGTNLDLLAETHMPARIDREGKVVIDAVTLDKLLKSKGDVRITADDAESVTVLNGIRAVVRQLPLEEWPADPPSFADCPSFELHVSTLAEILPAASNDAGRPILNAVLFTWVDGVGEAVATDSYRLHLLQGVPSVDDKVLVPADVLRQVFKAGHDGRVSVSSEQGGVHSTRRLKITAGPNTWYRFEEQGEFPNYRNLIPPSVASKLIVERADLVEAIAAVSVLLGTSDVAPVRLELTPETCTVRVNLQDRGDVSKEIPCTWDGEPGIFAFNDKYLAECCKAASESTLVIGVNDPLKPAMFKEGRPDGTTSIRLLMPVRVP